jgi:AP2 domain
VRSLNRSPKVLPGTAENPQIAAITLDSIWRNDVSRGSVYGISRVDNEVSRTHGWLVTIQRRGVIHRKHFSDGVHGGKQKSFAAAKTYRDEVITKNPPFSMREYSNIVKKNNRSGVVGVCRYCASETRDLPEDKQRWFWVASWPLPDGRRKRVKFSVKKYGEEGAFKMALKARKDALRGLDGAFDPGAVRRKPARRKAESSELRKAA